MEVAWFHSWGLCIKEMAAKCAGEEFNKWTAINNAVHELYNRPVSYFTIDYVGVEDDSGLMRTVVDEINRRNVERYEI